MTRLQKDASEVLMFGTFINVTRMSSVKIVSNVQ